MENARHGRPGDPPAEVTIRCYVRPSVAAEPVDETLKTLRAYEEAGRCKRVLVEVWPDKVRLPEPTSHDRVVDTYRLFEAWADEHGVDLNPAFTRQRCTSQFTETTWVELITPVICLAVYREGRLVGVYPHRDDDEVVTVRDVLTALEAGTLPTPPADEGRGSTTGGTGSCPACDGGLVSGQGLYLCSDCQWLGIATAAGTYRRVERPRGRLASR